MRESKPHILIVASWKSISQYFVFFFSSTFHLPQRTILVTHAFVSDHFRCFVLCARFRFKHKHPLLCDSCLIITFCIPLRDTRLRKYKCKMIITFGIKFSLFWHRRHTNMFTRFTRSQNTKKVIKCIFGYSNNTFINRKMFIINETFAWGTRLLMLGW